MLMPSWWSARASARRQAAPLHLEAEPASLLVAVSDGSAVEPIVRELSGTEESGRGMAIVSTLVGRWGVEPWGPGKRVWVRLDRSHDGTVRAEAADGSPRASELRMRDAVQRRAWDSNPRWV